MIAPLCAALALAVAAAPAGPARARERARAPVARTPARPAPSPALERARAQLAAVKRDPARRRYRHHWERAIAALERAARGRDAPAALLEAARARYALYRFSQVDADREAALALALRARRAGAREGAALAAAIRREMGEDEPERAAPKVAKAAATPRKQRAPHAGPLPGGRRKVDLPPTSKTRPSSPSSTPSSTPSPSSDEEVEDGPDDDDGLDPVLQRALAAAAARADADAPQAASGAATSSPEAPARLGTVRTWSNPDYTRVAIAVSRPVRFTQEELPPSGGAPRRLALDLSPALVPSPLDLPIRDALVRRVRAFARGVDGVRVVLDLAGDGEVSAFALDDPPRLIVDVGVSEARREAQALALRGGEGEAGPRRPIRRIVVDAGHGGHDAGAIGPSRVREKDVTLAMARRLARRLEARGFEVVLTRDRDRYVALEERTAIANARRGDLFVSLHANAHPRRDRRGLETYVLDVADGRYARRLAARENGAWREEGDAGLDVRRILTDLDARASAEASRRLAGAVQAELVSGLRGQVGDVRDLGVKSAVFYVLLGARMPAVLIETAFISNRTEERRLASARYQDEVAASVARAVEGFARREARVASAARPAVD